MSDTDIDQKKDGFFYRLAQAFKEEGDDVTEADIIELVKAGKKQGNLKASEAAMILNIFAFDDKDAKDIMVPRKDIVAIDATSTLREALELFEENHFSRLPVFWENLDNIIGIIHVKDLFHYSSRSRDYDKGIKELDDLIGPAQFVPETHGLPTLLAQMQAKKSHMAIVLDEYGQTSGLIALEDVIEEIVGEIEDEHDEESPTVKILRDGLYRMNGRTALDDVSKVLSVTFEDLEVTTLNGLLISIIDRIPEEHKPFKVKRFGYEFHALDVKDKVVGDVIVRKISSDEDPAEKT